MELFLEFLLTIALSLVFSFFLAKILSVSSYSSSSTNYECDLVSGLKPFEGLNEKAVTFERHLEAELEKNGSEGQKRTGFVENVVEVDALSEPRQVLDDKSGSFDDVKITEYEILREVEVENGIEEENLVFRSIEGEKIVNFEKDLSKDEADVAKNEEIEVPESECYNEIDIISKSKDYGRKSGIIKCEEILVDKSNDSGKISKIEPEVSKTKVGMARSEQTENLEGKCDNQIEETNKIKEAGCKSGNFESEELSVDRSNVNEEIAEIEPEISKTEVGMATSEEREIFKCKYDNEIGEGNQNEEHGSKSCIFESEERSVGRSNEPEKIAKIEPFCRTEMGLARSEEIEILDSECDDEISGGIKNLDDGLKEVLIDEDDDWEGIERTELERLFGAAVAFVGNKSNADRVSSLGSDVKMQLYGLHKVATVGPCHDPQPIALKVSARANWNAWKRLGNMTPEVAMEHYVTILSRSIPGCIQDDIGGDVKWISMDTEAISKLAADLKTWQADQLGDVDTRQKI